MRDIGLGRIATLAVIAIAVAVWIALFQGWDSL
jgi:low affinity Fe/Cu permease